MKDFKRGGGFDDKKRGGFDRRDSSERNSNHGSEGRGFGHGGFGHGAGASTRPAMYSATCAECGNSCEVPFKPTGDRPVYCSNCFKGKKEGFTSQRSDNRDFSKPRFDAPVRSSAPVNNSAPSNEQFAKLNAKLDKILSILDSITVEEEGDVETDMDESEEIEAPKAAASKAKKAEKITGKKPIDKKTRKGKGK